MKKEFEIIVVDNGIIVTNLDTNQKRVYTSFADFINRTQHIHFNLKEGVYAFKLYQETFQFNKDEK